MSGLVSVTLYEWETRTPDRSSPLAGLQLDDSSRLIAERLKEQGRMEVLELSCGLEIRATSFIGRVSLGDLTITVRPKIPGAPFLNLLRYAYQLRDFDLHRDLPHNAAEWAFQDLLVQELAHEATDLVNRGLHREYERVEADLIIPRGRIAFNGAAAQNRKNTGAEKEAAEQQGFDLACTASKADELPTSSSKPE